MKKGIIFMAMQVLLLVYVLSTIGCASVSTKHLDPNTPWQEQALVLVEQEVYGSTLINFTSYAQIAGVDTRSSTFTVMAGQVCVIPAGRRTIYYQVRITENGRTTIITPDDPFTPSFSITADLEPGGRYVLASYRSDVNLMTIEEYQVYWNTHSNYASLSSSTPEFLETNFNRRIVSKFEKAVAQLSK